MDSTAKVRVFARKTLIFLRKMGSLSVNQRERAKIGDGVESRDVGSLLRERRKHLGLTQADLADIAGVSPRFVYDLERGKETVALDRTLKVITTLGLTMTIGDSE
jgi:y4mF family transcriptional regulator